MVGADKPNRSEEQSGTHEEQEKHAQQVRDFLDANAPKRQLKPARSDAAELTSIDMVSGEPPERSKYLHLVASGVPLETRGSGDVSAEFTESDYYQSMAAIDKAHHTTGTGFIKMDKSADDFHLSEGDPAQMHARHRCNPAMNDWEPAASSTFESSSKPSRSESSA
jgi:hypothetical protein